MYSGSRGGGAPAHELAPLGDAERANAELRAAQFKAVTAFNRLRDDAGRLGGAQDTAALRRRLAAGAAAFRAHAQAFGAAAAAHPARDATATQKIMRDFQGLLAAAERVMAEAREKEGRSPPRDAAAAAAAAARQRGDDGAAADAEERAALLEQQRRQQQLAAVEGQLAFTEAVVEERDEAIAAITGQIGEVHQIFQDLAVLVHDQGEQLGDIEAHIEAAGARAAGAHAHIVRAERSQRAARNSWCFLMLLAVGVLVVLLLVLMS